MTEGESLEDFVGSPDTWSRKAKGAQFSFFEGAPRPNLFAYVPDRFTVDLIRGAGSLAMGQERYLFGWLKGQKFTSAYDEMSRIMRPNYAHILRDHKAYDRIAELERGLRRLEWDADAIQFGQVRMIERLQNFLDVRGQDELDGHLPFFARLSMPDGGLLSPELSGHSKGYRATDYFTLKFLHQLYGRSLFLACDRVDITEEDEGDEDEEKELRVKQVVFAFASMCDVEGKLPMNPYAQFGILDQDKKEFVPREE